METEFSSRRSTKRAGGIIVIAFGILLLLIGGFWYMSAGKNKMVSPLPSVPSYEIIFYTPTPAISVAVIDSTPSATPKGQKPSATPKPTVKLTATSTPSPTKTVSITPTKTVSPTPKG